MNDALDYIQRTAALARQETAPQGDVSRRILHRIHEPEGSLLRPMLVFAAGYAAVASVALVFGGILLSNMADPLSSMFQTVNVLLP